MNTQGGISLWSPSAFSVVIGYLGRPFHPLLGYQVCSWLFFQVVQKHAPLVWKNWIAYSFSYFFALQQCDLPFRVLAMNSEKSLHCQLWVQINGFVLIHWVIGNISSNKAFCLAHASWPRWIQDLLYHLLRRINLIVNITSMSSYYITEEKLGS